MKPVYHVCVGVCSACIAFDLQRKQLRVVQQQQHDTHAESVLMMIWLLTLHHVTCPPLNSWPTTSPCALHCFYLAPPPAGATLVTVPPMVATDPGGRCAAALLYGRTLAILPAFQADVLDQLERQVGETLM